MDSPMVFYANLNWSLTGFTHRSTWMLVSVYICGFLLSENFEKGHRFRLRALQGLSQDQAQKWASRQLEEAEVCPTQNNGWCFSGCFRFLGAWGVSVSDFGCQHLNRVRQGSLFVAR